MLLREPARAHTREGLLELVWGSPDYQPKTVASTSPRSDANWATQCGSPFCAAWATDLSPEGSPRLTPARVLPQSEDP